MSSFNTQNLIVIGVVVVLMVIGISVCLALRYFSKKDSWDSLSMTDQNQSTSSITSDQQINKRVNGKEGESDAKTRSSLLLSSIFKKPEKSQKLKKEYKSQTNNEICLRIDEQSVSYVKPKQYIDKIKRTVGNTSTPSVSTISGMIKVRTKPKDGITEDKNIKPKMTYTKHKSAIDRSKSHLQSTPLNSVSRKSALPLKELILKPDEQMRDETMKRKTSHNSFDHFNDERKREIKEEEKSHRITPNPNPLYASIEEMNENFSKLEILGTNTSDSDKSSEAHTFVGVEVPLDSIDPIIEQLIERLPKTQSYLIQNIRK